METKYIHSHQLLTAKNNIGENLHPLKTLWHGHCLRTKITPHLALRQSKQKAYSYGHIMECLRKISLKEFRSFSSCHLFNMLNLNKQ